MIDQECFHKNHRGALTHHPCSAGAACGGAAGAVPQLVRPQQAPVPCAARAGPRPTAVLLRRGVTWEQRPGGVHGPEDVEDKVCAPMGVYFPAAAAAGPHPGSPSTGGREGPSRAAGPLGETHARY